MPDRWWDKDPDERYWLELSDRDPFGVDLNAPESDKTGKPQSAYALIKDVRPGVGPSMRETGPNLPPHPPALAVRTVSLKFAHGRRSSWIRPDATSCVPDQGKYAIPRRPRGTGSIFMTPGRSIHERNRPKPTTPPSCPRGPDDKPEVRARPAK